MFLIRWFNFLLCTGCGEGMGSLFKVGLRSSAEAGGGIAISSRLLAKMVKITWREIEVVTYSGHILNTLGWFLACVEALGTYFWSGTTSIGPSKQKSNPIPLISLGKPHNMDLAGWTPDFEAKWWFSKVRRRYMMCHSIGKHGISRGIDLFHLEIDLRMFSSLKIENSINLITWA